MGTTETKQATHTPGPWYWTEHGIRTEDGPTSYRITGPDLETLGYSYGYSALDEANARLIAAAPDLLEACEAALDLFGETFGPENVEAGEVLAIIETAIAKARGEVAP